MLKPTVSGLDRQFQTLGLVDQNFEKKTIQVGSDRLNTQNLIKPFFFATVLSAHLKLYDYCGNLWW